MRPLGLPNEMSAKEDLLPILIVHSARLRVAFLEGIVLALQIHPRTHISSPASDTKFDDGKSK